MIYNAKSIRTFIGAKNYKECRAFYKALGFSEIELGPTMCLIKVNDQLAFYLQDAYEKKWIENSMIFLEVDDVEVCEQDLKERRLPETFAGVRLTDIKNLDWGRELFMHDPSGVLWHFGEFKKP
jgi:catechol 2,3-dioxygenase-like lactoylglutathione lyase family enzyme